MKLIKTKLLLKHNHNSAVGIATSSHIDFCKYQFRHLRPTAWKYIKAIMMFIESSFVLLFIPFVILTHGLILYPFWIVVHILNVKKIVKRFGIKYINKSAEKLVKEVSEKEE